MKEMSKFGMEKSLGAFGNVFPHSLLEEKNRGPLFSSLSTVTETRHVFLNWQRMSDI